MTAKQILAMDYGTSQQMTAADNWYKRFMAFCEKHEYLLALESTWKRIHFTDVFYQARRRHMAS